MSNKIPLKQRLAEVLFHVEEHEFSGDEVRKLLALVSEDGTLPLGSHSNKHYMKSLPLDHDAEDIFAACSLTNNDVKDQATNYHNAFTDIGKKEDSRKSMLVGAIEEIWETNPLARRVGAILLIRELERMSPGSSKKTKPNTPPSFDPTTGPDGLTGLSIKVTPDGIQAKSFGIEDNSEEAKTLGELLKKLFGKKKPDQDNKEGDKEDKPI